MDSRVEHIFTEEMRGDTSFQEKDDRLLAFFVGKTKYSQEEMRDTWHSGIKLGIEIGLRHSSPQGQKIELNANTPDGREKEFLQKFYKLSDEYNCAIEYHPVMGMIAVVKE